MSKVIINPEFGTKDVAIQMGVRMLKNPMMSMQDILDFTDNEMLVTVEDEDVSDENSDVTEGFADFDTSATEDNYTEAEVTLS
jgi:hypothetical protein